MAENLLEAAKNLAPMIRANLDLIDSECQLPPDLAEVMAQKGFLVFTCPDAWADLN